MYICILGQDGGFRALRIRRLVCVCVCVFFFLGGGGRVGGQSSGRRVDELEMSRGGIYGF